MRNLLCILILVTAARADYQLPKAHETHVLLADTWEIKGERLVISGHSFRIDLFWLADKIASDLICTGGYRPRMKQYMGALKGPIAIELSAVKPGDTLFVSGLWPRDVYCKTRHGVKVIAEQGRKTLARLDRRRDLVFEIKQVEGKFKITLVNRSKTNSYNVVKPGDGSAYGWRPPHIGFTIEKRGEKGGWAALERKPLMPRCGVFDRNWQDDVAELKPGARVSLDGWVEPTARYDMAKPGRYRLVVSYRYKPNAEDKTGAMGSTPTFELSSNPFEFKIP